MDWGKGLIKINLKRLRRAVCVTACLTATQAAALTNYGCQGLESSEVLPSVEGTGGNFYRISPDLMMFNWLADESLAHLSDLSEALQSMGTQLIYVPVPTKALAMPQQLPLEASYFGYRPDLAASVYEESLVQLKAAGVVAVDANQALRQQAFTGQMPFYGTDYRMTSAGGRALAKAVANALNEFPVYQTLPKSVFTTAEAGTTELQSAMRHKLQEHCDSELPSIVAGLPVTQRAVVPGQPGQSNIFATTQQTGRIAVIGTELSEEPTTNFTGYLSEFSGLDVVKYTVTGGNTFDAISSYLTSSAFIQNRPAFLVWENPIWNGLGNYGDQPMRELIAAARGACGISIPTIPTAKGKLRADLSTLDLNQQHTLMIDTGAPSQYARFNFGSRDGMVRTRSVYRNPEQELTGRFFMPLSGLLDRGTVSVDVEIEGNFGNAPRLKLCL